MPIKRIRITKPFFPVNCKLEKYFFKLATLSLILIDSQRSMSFEIILFGSLMRATIPILILLFFKSSTRSFAYYQSYNLRR